MDPVGDDEDCTGAACKARCGYMMTRGTELLEYYARTVPLERPGPEKKAPKEPGKQYQVDKGNQNGQEKDVAEQEAEVSRRSTRVFGEPVMASVPAYVGGSKEGCGGEDKGSMKEI